MSNYGGTRAALLHRERFAHEYVTDFNGAAAYKRVFPKATARTAASNAYKFLNDPRVQALLQAHARKHLESIDVDGARVLTETGRIAIAQPQDPVKFPDKLRALELLAKIHGLLKDQPPPPSWNIDPATLATLSTEDLEKALDHANKMQDFLSGKKTQPTLRPHLHDMNRTKTCWCGAIPGEPHHL